MVINPVYDAEASCFKRTLARKNPRMILFLIASWQPLAYPPFVIGNAGAIESVSPRVFVRNCS